LRQTTEGVLVASFLSEFVTLTQLILEESRQHKWNARALEAVVKCAQSGLEMMQ
jgi:hypothetical protein